MEKSHYVHAESSKTTFLYSAKSLEKNISDGKFAT